VALKVSLQTDGEDHPTEYGDGQTLRASWTSSQILEVVFSNGEQMLARGTYEVSGDGQTLRVSTKEQTIVFNRS
jgi:hypothetical protein